ncbi:MAG: hypothetical protein CMJ83_02095 [Planctomycetes bacterium]|nr:hypothetical protein [Planctomycetota bacterium]
MALLPDLSIVVVNYNTSLYVEALFDTLFDSTVLIDGRDAVIEIVLVDNASRDEDHERLSRLAADPRVRLVRNTENVGYAIANNQGLHITSGKWHCVSNPDVMVQPGCLQRLIDCVETLPDAAIVGPMATMDKDGEVFMPPNELPDPYIEALTATSRHEHAVCRYNVRRRARYACRYWMATEPIPVAMLSGGFFLGRRDTFEDHGLFDPCYPLYYEDTDLFRRFHEQGLRLWHVPDARIVHHFSRSAIPRMKAAMYRNVVGARRYFKKFFGHAGLRTWNDMQDRAARFDRDQECPYEFEAVPPTSTPPTLDLPEGEDVYVEVAGNPKFSLTVGIFPGRAGPYELPMSFWLELANIDYWCRAASVRTGDTIKVWRLTKCPAT